MSLEGGEVRRIRRGGEGRGCINLVHHTIPIPIPIPNCPGAGPIGCAPYIGTVGLTGKVGPAAGSVIGCSCVCRW